MAIQRPARGSIIFKVVIVILVLVLAWVLYQPYVLLKEEEAYKKESRLRMTNIRTGQLQHIGAYGRYATDLESLILFLKTDSLVIAKMDSLFKPLSGGIFVPESLVYAPKSHQRYMLEVDDTSTVKKYFLQCPDGYGSIGSLTDDSRINKASWED